MPSKRAGGRSSANRFCSQTSQPLCARAIAARLRRAFQADRLVAEDSEGLQVAPRPAAEVEDGERRRALQVAQQRRDVLADVVVARARPERLGALVVVGEGGGGDARQLARRSAP